MRILDSVIGHTDTIERILESFESGKPGQTFLFVGPSGIGKKLIATGLAQALLCEKGRRACGKCGSCLRVASGHHEAYMLVEPDGQHIKIDQAREIINKLSFKSMGENRVILMDEAQTLNPQAANSLLKILEEPPAGTFFFLIAPTQAGLLPTIRSRSRIVHFKPLLEAQIAQKEKSPAWMIKACGGSFEKLKTLQDGPEQEVRGKAIELMQLFLNDPAFLTNETWRVLFKDRSQAQRYFGYWVTFMRDALFFLSGGQGQIVNLDQPALIKLLAQKGPDQLLSLIGKCLKSEQAVAANQDGVLLLEKIWVTEKYAGANHVD